MNDLCRCSYNGYGWPHEKRSTCPVDTSDAELVSFISADDWAKLRALQAKPRRRTAAKSYGVER